MTSLRDLIAWIFAPAVAHPTPPPAPTPPPPTPAPPTPTPAPDEATAVRVLAFVNREREARGLAALAPHPRLDLAARGWADEMGRRGKMNHAGFRGRLANAVGPNVAGAENVAAGQHHAAEVVADWMESPGHRANILGRSFARAGCGSAPMRPAGRAWCLMLAADGPPVAQMFGDGPGAPEDASRPDADDGAPPIAVASSTWLGEISATVADEDAERIAPDPRYIHGTQGRVSYALPTWPADAAPIQVDVSADQVAPLEAALARIQAVYVAHAAGDAPLLRALAAAAVGEPLRDLALELADKTDGGQPAPDREHPAGLLSGCAVPPPCPPATFCGARNRHERRAAAARDRGRP